VNRLSILLADDHDDVRALFELSLSNRGHAVVAVGTGREAIACLSRDRFDVLVTDIVMPDGDGLDVIKAARQGHPHLRIIAVSGGGRYVNGQYCRNLASALGADVSLPKPVRPDRLVEVVEQMSAAAVAPGNPP
jgi:CheY-like chemotaxis protein